MWCVTVLLFTQYFWLFVTQTLNVQQSRVLELGQALSFSRIMPILFLGIYSSSSSLLGWLSTGFQDILCASNSLDVTSYFFLRGKKKKHSG